MRHPYLSQGGAADALELRVCVVTEGDVVVTVGECHDALRVVLHDERGKGLSGQSVSGERGKEVREVHELTSNR